MKTLNPLTILKNLGRFVVFVNQHFTEDHCMRSASALAYSTLLSSVPLMAIIFNTLSAFPAFQELNQEMQNFVFRNFVPAAGEVVQEYLLTFTQKTSQLTIIGIVFLIFTALMMLRTIDQSLNTIWHNQRPRSVIHSLLVYWAILSIGPLLVGASIFLTSYFFSMPVFEQLEPGLWQYTLRWLPFISTTAAFTLIYVMIPNQRVPWRPAFIGGILAASLFEIAKRGFALYVTHSDAYTTIYGALATIPLFLVWIYVSWLVILLGAEVTYCVRVFQWEETDNSDKMHESDSHFILAFRILGHLWYAQCQGLAVPLEEIMEAENWHDENDLHKVLNHLEDAHWVQRNHLGHWSLSRDLDEVSILECYHLMSGGLSVLPTTDDLWNQRLLPLLQQLNHSTEIILNKSLKYCYVQNITDEMNFEASKPNNLA